MGYYIKSLPGKKSSPKWKVQFISYKKSDTQNSRAQKPKREWDVSKPRWASLGFYPSLTLGEARVRAKQLNVQLHLCRQEERIRKIAEGQAASQMRYDSVLPVEFVA